MPTSWIPHGVAHTLENVGLRLSGLSRVEGSLALDPAVTTNFLHAPFDLFPDFKGPAGSTLKRGRGKDHPRYGRFIYALAKTMRPDQILEVGTYAGGTAIGWGRAILENKKGKLISVDSDVYSRGTFPDVTRANLRTLGLPDTAFELIAGDSKQVLPSLKGPYTNAFDLVLVDGDHTYEGALRDIENCIPLVKKGGLLLVHDVDRNRRMDEATPEHPHPVHEAFMKIIREKKYEWCILKFIRKHLGIFRV